MDDYRKVKKSQDINIIKSKSTMLIFICILCTKIGNPVNNAPFSKLDYDWIGIVTICFYPTKKIIR